MFTQLDSQQLAHIQGGVRTDENGQGCIRPALPRGLSGSTGGHGSTALSGAVERAQLRR